MAKRLQYDRYLLGATLFLVIVGLAMVFSASAMLSLEHYQTPYHYLLRQLLYAAGGLLTLLGALRLDYRRLRSPLVVYPAVCITLLLLALALALPERAHTHRWIYWRGLSFEPSELAKLVLILFLAFWLDRHPGLDKLHGWRDGYYGLRQAAAVAGPIVLLVLFERDLGTPLALTLTAAAMLYAAGLRLRFFAAALTASLPVLYWQVFHIAYRRDRILAFLHPWAHARSYGFQIVQSLIAIGTGGFTGLGYMNGRQKLFFLPDPHTDFIFSIIGEEWGLAGATLVLLAFVIVLSRGLRLARRAPEIFGRQLAVGITTLVLAQALINMSVATSLLPNKGIPLPFISYGGSSLWFTLAAIGLLLSISQQTG